ncbi:MAG: glycoside hydrolase family 20 zincin-like fold domain-containing protein [Planctomycetota bacterium]
MHLAPLLALVPAIQDWSPPPPPPVVPATLMSQPRFAPFVVPDALRVVTSESALEPLAPLVASLLGGLLDRPVEVGAPPSRSGDVVLTLGYLAEPVAASDEGFAIEVFDDHVALSGNEGAGIARAVARLLQLFEKSEETGAWSLPPVRIDDAPAYGWRALEVEGTLDARAALRALEIAHLASFNVVVVGGRTDDDPAVASAARLRGIQLIVGDAKGRPTRWTSGADADDVERARSLSAQALLDATSAVPAAGIDTPSADEIRAAFAYRPLASLVEAWGGAGAEGVPTVAGARVLLPESALAPAAKIPPLLPYAADALWGRRAADLGLEAYRARAEAFRARVAALPSAAGER